MKKVMAQLRASLDIECPHCEHEFDLFKDDDEGLFMVPIFNNRWDDLRGETVDCPNCHVEFEMEAVEW